MFGLLNSSQIYGLQQEVTSPNTNSHNNKTDNKQRRSASNASDTGKESKFFASLSSMQGSMKSPTNFIEKFIKTELLNGYDTIKNYKNFQHSSSSTSPSSSSNAKHSASGPPEGILNGFNCLHGSYRSNCESEFYEPVNVSKSTSLAAENDMTIKCSKNLLAVAPSVLAPATLQNYQKLSECGERLTLTTSSGASSGEFNSDNVTHTPIAAANTGSSSLYKKLSFGRGVKNLDGAQTQEVASDNSSSSISTTTTNSSANTNSTSNKSTDLQRTSSASSSSNDCATTRERKKSLSLLATNTTSNTPPSNASSPGNTAKTLSPERAQRRKLIQMISSYDQHNKLLQRELAKEKRRRTEELACVVKSLICFESKLKTDMKSVNQRLGEKDVEICRLVRQNRALRKQLAKAQKVAEQESACDEGVVEDETEAEQLSRDGNDNDDGDLSSAGDKALLMEDCLVLEALQCINCRKQFYDIDLKEGCTQTASKDGIRNNDDHTTEHDSSSDDTVSSSFYGARRSVRYTSKRTSGTFRDYMRSRSMNIDDPALTDQHNSEETTSTISRDDSQASYEKINIYSRTIERMHGVKCAENERGGCGDLELSGLELMRPGSRASIGSRKSNGSGRDSRNSSKASDLSASKKITQIEEDDGIFSPTQDDEDFEEDLDALGSLKIVQRRSMEFSEASPKQVYETSTDDWYASASDQEEIVGTTTSSKCYGHGAINPVLECVNQILLQQSMEEPHDGSAGKLHESSTAASDQIYTPKTPNQLLATTANLPRRSSLSDRRSSRSNSHSSDGQNSRNGTLTRKRVHFSTKNSMVHVPRNDDHTDDEDDDEPNNESIVKSLIATEMISNCSTSSSSSSSALTQYHAMNNYLTQVGASNQNLQNSTPITNALTSTNASPTSSALMPEHERLDTLNYESIYSNEYEPIGSEHNSSNLYVDMESTAKMAIRVNSPHSAKMPKMPPALPPKPANLLKFKKSLQQLDEMPDEHLSQDCCNVSVISNAHSEPDYCSISEVNVVVQIVADIHKPPAEASEAELEANDEFGDFDVEVSTVASDDTCAATHKTDEIEEIFADIPKLPNVAAIIAPKHSKYSAHAKQSDYLVMSPKVEAHNLKLPGSRARKINLNLSLPNEYLTTPGKLVLKSTKETTPLKLQLNGSGGGVGGVASSQYKRKHVPNILAEINKRMSQPNSPTTPTKLCATTTKTTTPAKSASSSLLKSLEDNSPNMPLQAEFDWYNLDLEYGKAPLKSVNEGHTGSAMLAEIHEDHEGVVAAADEYNLDEEFSLTCEGKLDTLEKDDEDDIVTDEAETKDASIMSASEAICEAINFPLYSEHSSPNEGVVNSKTKAKKIKKNLANFEKFIEGSGLSTKPLPSKRKIYFSGPFV